MRQSATAMPRRHMIAGVLGACVLARPLIGRAAGLVGIAALDTPAIPVKNPVSVILIAIANAGNRMVAAGEHGVIIYSDDNAASWRQAAVPVDVTLTCITFATPSIGWAAGHFGVILNTRDGGETWQEQLNGIQANQLTLAAAQNAAIDNANSPGAPLALRRANYFVQAGPDKPFLSILALGPKKAIAFGAYRMTMITEDGGKSWADWSLRIGDRLSQNLYAAAMVGPSIYIAAEEGLVFCSTDGGEQFPQSASPSSVTLFGVLGAPDGSVIVFGVAGNCFRSTDAGKTWRSLNVGTQDNLTAGLVLRSGAVVIASETGALFVSHDNGNSFSPVSDVPPMTVSGAVQAPDGSLVFVGFSGVTRVPAGPVSA